MHVSIISCHYSTYYITFLLYHIYTTVTVHDTGVITCDYMYKMDQISNTKLVYMGHFVKSCTLTVHGTASSTPLHNAHVHTLTHDLMHVHGTQILNRKYMNSFSYVHHRDQHRWSDVHFRPRGPLRLSETQAPAQL